MSIANLATLPKVFIGSSSRALPVVRAIQKYLRDVAEVVPWDDAFALSRGHVENVSNIADRYDFAILLLADDDERNKAGATEQVPRDNVIFELGWFMARLGRERTYFLMPEGKLIGKPTDLDGLLFGTYSCSAANLGDGPALAKIRGQIAQLGRRKAYVDDEQAAFCAEIAGCWWELIHGTAGETVNLISFVRLDAEPARHQVRFSGHGYDAAGKPAAGWHTTAACLDARDLKVVYRWEGVVETGAVKREGLGELQFFRDGGNIDRANGTFIDANSSTPQTSWLNAISMRRASVEDVNIMLNGNGAECQALLSRLLEFFRVKRG